MEFILLFQILFSHFQKVKSFFIVGIEKKKEREREKNVDYLALCAHNLLLFFLVLAFFIGLSHVVFFNCYYYNKIFDWTRSCTLLLLLCSSFFTFFFSQHSFSSKILFLTKKLDYSLHCVFFPRSSFSPRNSITLCIMPFSPKIISLSPRNPVTHCLFSISQDPLSH